MSENTDNAAVSAPEAKPEAINASCRLPVLFLFFSAAIWAVQASAAGVLGSLKMHIPGFLADCPYLTYGRMQANAWVAFLFGFGGNAGLGLTLWMLSRLRGMELARPGFVVAGTVLWNVGVTAAMVGITMGDQPGVAGYELPAYASRVLLIGQAFIAFSAILTYFSRRHKQLYPSSWYLIASLVAFPWIVGTAHWLLVETPVRGAAQIPVAHWAVTSLQQIWLGCMGLAALIYFIPKITQRELHSRQWAAFGFWMLLILGGWVNLNSGSPLPVWSIKLSQFASALFVFVLVAVGWNLCQTAKGVPLIGSKDLTLKFMGVSLGSWLVVALFTTGNSMEQWNGLLQFTYAGTAMRHVFSWGFFAMAMFGAIYYVAPRLFGSEVDWACSGTYRWIFYLTTAGALIVGLAGMGMSYGHGKSLNPRFKNAGPYVFYSLEVEERNDLFVANDPMEFSSLHEKGKIKSDAARRIQLSKVDLLEEPIQDVVGLRKEMRGLIADKENFKLGEVNSDLSGFKFKSDEISISDLPGYDAWPHVKKKRALMPMRVAFLSELLFLGGSLIFLCSMGCLLFRNCCGECGPMAIIRQCRAVKAEGGAE